GRDHNPERTLDMLSTLTAIYGPRLFALMKDRKGISAVEYAVLAVGIVLVVAVAAAKLGGAVGATFDSVTAGL
ncbi:MAG: Flp family type IVb pilin, partial [Rhodospirillales bacterium]|nr:Flp family type IVb pilin [Rhodospirillales bacterium]